MSEHREGDEREQRRRTWAVRLWLAACGLAGFAGIQMLITRL